MFAQKEKTTVQIPSAPTDGEQSLSNASIITTNNDKINHSEEFSEENFLDFQRRLDRINDPAYLHTMTLNELYETTYSSRPPIIGGLLYPGTYLLAGAPKVGKSFLVAQLAFHISTGQPLWDFPVQKSTVLYLALEDDYRRLQDRMFRMFGVESTEHLHFATCAKQVGAGLEEQLELFLHEHLDTRLIIIDTLQKVRELGGEAYSYAGDYEIVGKLKTFADKHGICLLLVHHTRKQPASDKFEMISGTTGLLGCADGAFLSVKTGLTKKQKVTELYFNENDAITEVYSHNTELKKRLLAYAAKYPELCKQTDDDEQGGLRFEIDKSRLSIRLTAPYSQERREAASQLAKKTNTFKNII